tara:strand:- start:1258 stop:2349 length:1092 start_codon:yes stop_codon:yes gene_type:complete
MSYIGVPPVSGDFVVLDTITASATASYTLQRNSGNFVPESANHMLVSLNGSIQKPNSSFTVSGSTITFSEALTSSDSIDFILVLGNVNAVGVATTVSDSAITKAKTDFITDGSSAGVTVKGSGSDSGSIALNCSSNSHAIQLISPDHSAGQSYKLKLPDNNVTADKFLKVKSITGSGATATGQLEFADAGDTSNLVQVSSVTLSGSAYAHNSIFTSDYDTYFITLDQIGLGTGDTHIYFKFYNDTGATSDNTYRGYTFANGGSGDSSQSYHNAYPFLSVAQNGTANQGLSGFIYVSNPVTSGVETTFWYQTAYMNNSGYGNVNVGSGFATDFASRTHTGFYWFPSQGSFAGRAKVTVYGIKRS